MKTEERILQEFSRCLDASKEIQRLVNEANSDLALPFNLVHLYCLALASVIEDITLQGRLYCTERQSKEAG